MDHYSPSRSTQSEIVSTEIKLIIFDASTLLTQGNETKRGTTAGGSEWVSPKESSLINRGTQRKAALYETEIRKPRTDGTKYWLLPQFCRNPDPVGVTPEDDWAPPQTTPSALVSFPFSWHASAYFSIFWDLEGHDLQWKTNILDSLWTITAYVPSSGGGRDASSMSMKSVAAGRVFAKVAIREGRAETVSATIFDRLL